MKSPVEPDLVLVADDTETSRVLVYELLTTAGFRVLTVPDGPSALAALTAQPVAVAIIDLEMPHMTGIEVILQGRRTAPEVPFIILSAHVQHQVALDCMASGAFDFVPKPISREVLLFRVKRALTERRKADELLALRAARMGQSPLVAVSEPMRRIVSQIPSFAASEETVLVTGETGCGKEAVAREIHRLSRRSAEPFFGVNCGALTETLLESELFGHERGAFTGAVARRKGLFELAHGGTLFLDELSEMSPSTQVKLLRVLEERQFLRVGGHQPVKVDVRLICATNSDLQQKVAQKQFRADLYYRLVVLPIHLAPLRERSEDIPALLQVALERVAPARKLSLSPSAAAEATAYAWPGNVRELINAVSRAAALVQGERIETLGLDIRHPPLPETLTVARPLREHMAVAEREYLEALLSHTHGNLSEAAQIADVDRKSIYNKMKAHGLQREGFKT
ncbi:MAG: sigma-54-dependent transcriptional regulator [Myxococcaceae bacterium]